MASDLSQQPPDASSMAEPGVEKGEWDALSRIKKIQARVKASPRVSNIPPRSLEILAGPQQLPFWADEKRGLPNDFARGALFSVSKDDHRLYYKSVKVVSLAGIDITYKGEELRQDDLSVLLTTIHLYRQQQILEDHPVQFTVYSFLKELGWSHTSSEYAHLRECFDRLSANNVKVAAVNERRGYSASLIRKYEWKDQSNKTLAKWRVWLEPSIVDLFSADTYTLLQWNERKRIGHRAPLALWLHAFLSTHREPFAMSVGKYHELCGSKSKTMYSFRPALKRAFQKLVDIGFLEDFAISPNDLVTVKRVPENKRLLARQKAAKAKGIVGL